MDFLLCHNPLGRMPVGRVAYVYHPLSPRIFASLMEIDFNKALDDDYKYRGHNVIFIYNRKDGLRRLFMLMAIHGGERDTDKSLTVLHQAAEWYCTCLNEADEPIYGQSSWTPLHPYNERQAPRLSVLHMTAIDQFLLSYGTGTFSTPHLEEVTFFINALYKDGYQGGKDDSIAGAINSL